MEPSLPCQNCVTRVQWNMAVLSNGTARDKTREAQWNVTSASVLSTQLCTATEPQPCRGLTMGYLICSIQPSDILYTGKFSFVNTCRVHVQTTSNSHWQTVHCTGGNLQHQSNQSRINTYNKLRGIQYFVFIRLLYIFCFVISCCFFFFEGLFHQ